MRSKKFINDPDNLVQELLEGYVAACSNKVSLTDQRLIVRSKPKRPAQVGVVSLGGSGHEPALIGYVGEGLLDVSVPGEIFAAPGPRRCLEAIKLADSGAGVLLIVLNHSGDVLSGTAACNEARALGINIQMLLTHEDISSAGRDRPQDRRGLVGFLPVYKIAGAAAERGWSLEQVHAVARRAADNMATLSVACQSATNPVTGHVLSELGDDEMEIGAGQHGESSMGRQKMASADDTAAIMLDRLLTDLEVRPGDRLLVIVNGMGATTLMELFIVYRQVARLLDAGRIEVVRSLVGEFITAQEQAGFQLCLVRMDAELLQFWDASCDSPYWVVR